MAPIRSKASILQFLSRAWAYSLIWIVGLWQVNLAEPKKYWFRNFSKISYIAFKTWHHLHLNSFMFLCSFYPLGTIQLVAADGHIAKSLRDHLAHFTPASRRLKKFFSEKFSLNFFLFNTFSSKILSHNADLTSLVRLWVLCDRNYYDL